MYSLTKFWSGLVTKYGKTKVIVGGIVLFVILLLIVRALGNEATVEEVALTETPRTVSLYTISEADGTAVRTADGKAFIVRAESGGRVERVANVGDIVERGAIVAQIENSAQRAAVLQAQGAYEAARAGATQSDLGSASAERAYDEALTQAVNSFRSAFSDADDILRNTVDQVFSQPDSFTPGLRIDGQGRATTLSEDRVELEKTFDAWRVTVQSGETDDVKELLDVAEENTTELATLIVTLASLLSDDDAISDETLLASLRADFADARSRTNGVLQSLSGARSALIQAENARNQADIAGTAGDVSLADAQVKQALGVLESARAALAKTSVKSPVAGTVTAVSISVGDIINVGSDVVFVAGDATGETEDTVTVPLTAVKFTPTKAFVFTVEDNKLVAHEVTTGLVTTNSITISRVEGVRDIVLDVRGLKEGDTVSYKVES